MAVFFATTDTGRCSTERAIPMGWRWIFLILLTLLSGALSGLGHPLSWGCRTNCRGGFKGITDIPVCDNGFLITDRNVCDTLVGRLYQYQVKSL